CCFHRTCVREPSPSGGGGSTHLLSFHLHVRHDPALRWTPHTNEFSGCHFQERFTCHHVFHHKSPFNASSTNKANYPFSLHDLVQLPAMHLFRCPDPMLAPLPVI